MSNKVSKAVVILGPTASGKTKLAVRLAGVMDGEIISVDSRQVYKGLNLGSGKDLHEYKNIPYHLIDVAEPGQEYSLFEYLRDVQTALTKIESNSRLPVFAGGTGLYLNALLHGYSLTEAPVNPVLREALNELPLNELVARLESLKPLHNATDSIERERTVRAIEIAVAEQANDNRSVKIGLESMVIGIKYDADKLRIRIRQRLEARLADGLIEEVKGLQKQGLSWQKLDNFGLEYRYISWYLQGQLNKNDMQQKLVSAIVQFARKQLKWFRRMERNGISIRWLDGDQYHVEDSDFEDRHIAAINQLSGDIVAWLAQHPD